MKIKIKCLAILIIVLIINSIPSFSQKQKIVAKFIITDVTENGVNTTKVYLDNKAYTVFYTVNGDNRLNMANVWDKSDTQSFGPVYSFTSEKSQGTENKYEVDIFNFIWEYHNSYNKKSGTSKVQVIKTYKPQGITFSLKLVTESLDVIIFKGYMEGSLDFSDFDK
ncbi:hypothetical protein PQG22_06900 [Aquirufa beregesia]